MSSRRKVQMSMWNEGHRRTSPRISGLNACKAQPMKRVEEEVAAASTNADAASCAARINGPASRTRARKKRKLRPLQDVAATCVSPIAQQTHDPESNGVEDDKEKGHEHHPSNSDRPFLLCDGINQATCPDQSSVLSVQWMPEKRILELVLDILQRRDTHEIFAQPVDPEEAEDYYEIIKEPMDFGTMRAKLHEGMYTSLEQFEHDVFLISGNAMHFNSSSTIYFRQARAIHELSKKVFHALKTNAKNFELEFSETRRRNSRRTQTEARGPIYSSSPKPAKNLTTYSTTVNYSSKTIPHSLSSSSNFRRSIQGNLGYSSAATPFSEKDHEILSGGRDDRRTSFPDADRRCTYNPLTSVLNENDSLVSTIYDNSKALKHVNQQDVGYRESLILFVRDLGPTAQMFAKRKLHGLSAEASSFQTSNSNCWFQAPQCQNPSAFALAQQRPTTLDCTFSFSMSQNLSDHHQNHQTFPGNNSDRSGTDKGGEACTVDRLGIHAAAVEMIPDSCEKKISSAFRSNICTRSAINAVDVLGRGKFHKSENNGIKLGSNSSMVAARELNFSVNGLKDTGGRSTMIPDKNNLDNQALSLDSTMEYSMSEVFKFNLRNSDNSPSSSGPLQTTSMSRFQTKASLNNPDSECLRGDVRAIAAAQCQNHELESSASRQAIKSSQPLPLVSQFTFDLPYLKTRLDQIHYSRQERLLQPGSGGSILDKMSYQRVDNHHKCSMDPKHNDLVLQL